MYREHFNQSLIDLKGRLVKVAVVSSPSCHEMLQISGVPCTFSSPLLECGVEDVGMTLIIAPFNFFLTSDVYADGLPREGLQQLMTNTYAGMKAQHTAQLPHRTSATTKQTQGH